MNWHELTLKPQDILFFRDAKPMEASSVGCGANWPLPNVLHDALISTMKQYWPEPQEWEFEHKHSNKADNREDLSNLRFGGLQTTGLLPCRNGETFYPCPADIDPDGNQMLLKKYSGFRNLADFLKYGCTLKGKPSKKKGEEWITQRAMEKYLVGENISFDTSQEALYDKESRTGIAIDAQRGATEGGMLYLAEYLRLRDDVSLRGYAACESVCRASNATDALDKFFADGKDQNVVIGGQQGIAQVSADAIDKDLPVALPGGGGHGCYLKWILLTPAIFNNGWLPDWIDVDNGKVLLPVDKPERKPGESRADWRKRFPAALGAQLCAVRMEKPIVVSGWNLRKGGPRATRLAVPAGSVYWFKADSVEDAIALNSALHGRFKSNYFGEKGYGLGICQMLEEIETIGE
ncbi:MAG: type III-B CRISPR module-associated protein Cmr3 [Kiritimatiellia bacterium]